MATKKEKRARALAKRKAFLDKVKAEGLEAQRRDQEARAAREEALARVAQEYNERWQLILGRFTLR